MKEDVWLTVEEAISQILLDHPHVKSVKNDGQYLQAVNYHDVAFFKVRIFNGSEHELAKPGMVLDWRRQS